MNGCNEVEGFAFTNQQEYEEAKKEAESIEYMKANTDLSDIRETMKLYRKLVEHKTLRTVVGYVFLKQLQERIVKEELVNVNILPSILITNNKKANVLSGIIKDPEKKQEEKLLDYRIRLRNSRIISLFLLAIIIIMIIINIFSY